MAVANETLVDLLESSRGNLQNAGESIIAIDGDGQEEALERVNHHNRHSILLWALLIQAIDFLIFQIRNIILTLEEGPASEAVSTIAKQSEPALLGIAVCTALIETGVRATDLYRANDEEAPVARLFLGVPISKLFVLSFFCANAYYEETNSPNLIVAKAAAVLFIALLAFEMFVSAKISASLFITDYMAIALFIDFFFKAELFSAATLQYFPETAFIGFCLAAAGFTAVMANVIRIMSYHYREDTSPEQAPLRENRSPERRGNINDDVILSDSNPTFFGRFCRGLSLRTENVLPYVSGNLFPILRSPRGPGS